MRRAQSFAWPDEEDSARRTEGAPLLGAPAAVLGRCVSPNTRTAQAKLYVRFLLRLCDQLICDLSTVTCSTAEASEEGVLSQQLARLQGGSRLSQQLQSTSLPRRTASTARQAPEDDAGAGRQPLPAGGDVAILIESNGDSRKTARFRLSLTSTYAM